MARLPEYERFLLSKRHNKERSELKAAWLPKGLFDFQRYIVEWSLFLGRAAIFADCGLGKTPIQLTWAKNVVKQTNRPVLIATPLAVAFQTIAEGEKFGIECRRAIPNKPFKGISVINYEQLHKFDPSDYGALVCDESSILKSFEGVRRTEITEFMRKMRYRLLCTATPSPNDYFELGTSSEALGYLGYTDMLLRFFKNDQGNSLAPFRLKPFPTQLANGNRYHEPTGDKWRLKGHAEIPFWQWVCSWALAARSPSDLGFDNNGFVLPPLIQNEIVVPYTRRPSQGLLLTDPAYRLQEQRNERRETLDKRCEAAAEKISAIKGPSISWCGLNDEGDWMERNLSDVVQVSGKDRDEAKEEKLLAFVKGQVKRLVTKPKIGAWGLNLQHCAHMTYFPSHSYEQLYQSIRRCWRFGQKQKVVVDLILSEGDRPTLENIQRKTKAADDMFKQLVFYMNESREISGVVKYPTQEELPLWLS